MNQDCVPDFVLIRGVIYPGHDKAPFVPSGKSVRGCVAYKPVEDVLQCHVCGDWFESLASHIRSGVHPETPTVRDYKHKHYLRQGTSLINRRIQASLSAKCRPAPERMARIGDRTGVSRTWKDRRHSLYEKRNETATCHAQLVERIAAVVKEFGETPSVAEFARRGIHLYTLLDSFNVKGVPELMDMLGYGRNRHRGSSPTPDSDLLEVLRDFYVARGRLPKEDEWGHGALKAQATYRRAFGSTAEAYKRAGLGLVAESDSGFRVRIASDQMLKALASFYDRRGRIPRFSQFNTSELPFDAATVRNRFGSLRTAYETAGINLTEEDLRHLRSGRWNTPITKQDVKRSLADYLEHHEDTPTREEIQSGKLGISGTVIYKLFGTLRPEKLISELQCPA